MGKNLVKTPSKLPVKAQEKLPVGSREHFFKTVHALSQFEGSEKKALEKFVKPGQVAAAFPPSFLLLLGTIFGLGIMSMTLSILFLIPLFALTILNTSHGLYKIRQLNQRIYAGSFPQIAAKFLLSNYYVDNYWVKTIRNKNSITLQLIHKTYQSEWKDNKTSLEHFSYFYKQQIGQHVKRNKKRGKFHEEIIQEITISVNDDMDILEQASDYKIRAEQLNQEAREEIIQEIQTQTHVVNITNTIKTTF